jgi:serine/threonine-protein kinase
LRRLEAGDQLGRYKVLKRLGAGAMGEVYLAEDPQIGRNIALKTVLVQEGRAQELEERKRRLLREARAAGKLLHPNIIALFDAGEDQGILYLAFEFVEGKDLADRVAEGPQLSLGEALSIVRQAAEGLDYAHRQGVVHRDIKPSNLMITADGRVKIADFGIARVADQTSDLTMTGSVVGSPHYMSPEQIRGEELDGRTDLFSLGVLLYEILCRRRPFEGETLTTLVYQILNQEPTPLVVRRPDLGPRLEQLVLRMLHKDRDQRFASAAEVVREIAVCERELSADQLAGAAMREESPSDATVRMADRPPARPQAPAPPPASPPPPAPPPPPAGARAAAPAPAAAAAAPPAPKSRLALVAVIVALLLAVLVGGGLAARKFVAGLQAKATEKRADSPEKAEPARPASTPATTRPAPPVQTAQVGPSVQPTAPITVPASVPAAVPEADPRPAVTADPGTRATRPAEVAPTPAPVEPRREPAPVRPPAPRERPRPAPVEEPAPPTPAPTPREERREEVVERVPVDREMRTGMNLSFDLQPKEAAEQIIVKFDRTVIGLAADWNAKKRDGRAYSVPAAGSHVLSFLIDGNVVYRIRIEAEPGGPNPTTVSLSLPQFGKRGRRPGR